MIKELRRGTAVKRFHAAYRLQEETVGHHSCNVALLLLRLWPGCRGELIVAALTHDIAECYTGDVPAPFKWDNPDIAKGLKEGEEEWLQANKVPVPELTPYEKIMLKAADLADLAMSSMEEVNRGNLYAKPIVDRCREKILEMDLEESIILRIQQMVMEVGEECQQTISK